MALAIRSMSWSVPVPLMAFTAHRTNRVLSGVYPCVLSILSMLGEYVRWNSVPPPVSNSIPVTAHRPVQTEAPHPSVIVHSMPRSLERTLADLINRTQGELARV